MGKQNQFCKKGTKGKESTNNKKESESLKTLAFALTLQQIILLSWASKIFNLDLDTVILSAMHKNVINGINRLIDAAKKEGCITQTITEKIDISMEFGIILNIIGRQKQSNYTYKINLNTKTFSMNIVCDEIRFTIVVNRNIVTYKLIMSGLDESEILFDKQGEEETVVTVVGNKMTIL